MTTTTINGITFTDSPPTKPGAYWWWTGEPHEVPRLLNVFQYNDELRANGIGTFTASVDHGKVDGLWSARLVPADEVEKAYREGRESASSPIDVWNNSRARLVVEGEPV